MAPRDLLAWNVKKLRVKRGLSQERLALEAGLERVSISQLERKRVNLGIDSLGKIASVLGCKIFELFVEPVEGEQQPENLRRGRRSA
ncbi:helix-turn-helix transcriptional regulator [Rhizobium mongolense]|uniref:helix-turn-helix transcriptional regulator n=1 Tax=Rhizobium mongolense TaxID=57676 RepID=UPI003557DF12